MPGVTIACPQCQQKIINASPGGDGGFHCSSCGSRFGEPAVDAGSLFVSSIHSEPTGRPPEQTSYGLLSVAMWLLFIYLLVSNGLVLWSAQFGGYPLSKLNFLLGAGSHLLMAALGILTVIEFSRLDSRAAWIAWRCGADEPIGDPPGSSLRYILPLAVFGGITVIFASQGITDPQLNIGGSIARIGTATAGGIALLIAGLACGELRRYFWRMSKIGAALINRPRGEDLGLSIDATGSAIPESRSARQFRRMIICLLINFLWVQYTLQSRWMSSTHSVYIIFGLLAFLFSIGQLEPLFREMSLNWFRTGASIATQQRIASESYRRLLARVTLLATFSALVAANGVALIVGPSVGFLWSFENYGPWIALFIAYSFVNFWLIDLCHDSCAFADACARFSKPKVSGPTLLSWVTRFLCVTSFLYTGATFGAHCYNNWGSTAAFRTIPGIWWFSMAQGISQTIQVFLTITLPAIVWSLIALHMQRAAQSLERCVEVKKKPEVSAAPNPVQL